MEQIVDVGVPSHDQKRLVVGFLHEVWQVGVNLGFHRSRETNDVTLTETQSMGLDMEQNLQVTIHRSRGTLVQGQSWTNSIEMVMEQAKLMYILGTR